MENGRIGRMIITLLLWSAKVISAPHFYVSGYLEDNKDLCIDTMRAVSEKMIGLRGVHFS